MWNWLKSLWTKISPFFAKFVKTSSAKLAESLTDLAEVAITEMFNFENWTNSEKREAAIQRIMELALEEGRECTETAAATALQMVYSIMKDE